MPDPDAPMRLVMMIVADTDADELIGALGEQQISSTKVGSTGGFLRRGNVTIFSGVEAAQVDAVLETVNRICPVRTEMVPLQSLPFSGYAAFPTEPLEVRAGGAVVFVLDVERFQRL